MAIGTDASSAGNTSLALGKGATVENDSDGSYQAVVKSDDIAVGTGAKTTASDASTAIGKGSSVTQSTDALAVGSGAKVTTSKNAMAFGKGADAESAADSIAMGTGAKTISADTIAIGQNTSAEGANSVVIGKGAVTTDEGGNAIGTGSAASGSSTAIGQSATANNYNALAIGNNATANADKSISLGYNAGVGTSEGKGETQNAGSLIAIGTSAGNNVSGMQNVAIGESAGSNVKSSYNIAIGTQAGYGINYASDNKVQNGYNVSIGYKANYQENAADIMYATALGNEANASNYAVAISDGAKASGTNSLTLGYSAQASDAESMALGHNASAADGNVAIGNGSLAPAVSSLGTVKDGYVYQSTTSTDSSGAATTTLTELKSAFTYKPLASDSHYISVGTTELTRRISNVADGVFASDAATVGQLNSLNELLQATDTKVGLTKDYFEEKFTALNTTVDASKTHYFSVSTSSDNQTVNQDNTGATSGKADAMAIGPNANATNVKSLAVGNNVYATGLRSIAIGTAPNPTTDSAGTTTTHNTSSEGENSIALGTSTTAQADNSIAIGTRAQTYTTDTTSKTGAGSVAIGNLATTAGNQSVALGYDATVKYDYGTAIGSEALASGTDAVAVGKGSKAYSTDSTAIGQNNTVTGSHVYGLGSSNAISGNWGSIVQSGVSGYKNTVTSVSDQDTTNALTGVYMTGSSNTLNQDVKYNVMQDITVQGSSNTINGGAGGTSGHPNTLSQIAIVGSGNTVQGKSSDDSKTNNIKDVTILGYNNKVDANTDTTVDFSNTQILGSNVTAKLGNSVYLGSNAAYTGQTPAASDAITSARTAADAAAEASDAYKAATTDAEKAQIKAQYEAQYLYQLNVQAMEAKGTTAGTQSYSTDETYGDGTSYTYAGSSPAGVVTVGSVGAERRIQNVAAGLVSATSTDAVNGSQLYALTRQIRFGGDNSSFGTTTADDKNVVARGSNETIAITGGSDAVTASTTDGNTTYTVDATKLTDNNIAVVADTDNEALHVQLASNLKNLNTAQLGSGSGDSYKETIKLDGTGANGGQMTLAGADGTVKTTIDTTGLTVANGPKFTSSGIDAASQKINHVTAGSDDADAVNYGQLKNARTLLTKGANTTLSDTVNGDQHTYTVNVDNLAVKANGTGTTVALANGINFRNGTNTTSAVGTDGTVTIDTKNLTVKANGTNAGSVTMDTGLNFKDGTNTTVEAQDGTVKINATHNKVSTVSAAAGNQDNVTLTLTDTDGNQVASTGLKNTYTTISKDGTAHTVTFARNDGVSETLSLGDLNGASKDELTASVTALNSTIQTEAAKASSEVTNGTNVASVTKAAGNNNQNIYTVNVDDLAVKVNSSQKSVHLKDGLVFGNGTNTTATMSDDGTITYNISDATIKTRAKDAINLTAGSNVTVDTITSADGTTKTFTVKATHNKLTSATAATGDQDNVTLTLKDADGNEVTSTGLKNTYSTGGSVTYAASGEGTATVTRNDGNTYTITGLKDTKVTSGTASYGGTQGNASGSATLTMNDGSKVTISDLKDDYITSAAVDTENNHVTMTRLGGGTVDLNLNPILGKYSLSDYHLVGAGTTHDQAYAVDSNGTVTLNVVDDKNPNGTPKTIQITGLASQSGVNAGRTTVKSSDSSITVSDSTANNDTHTYDIKVDYSKIPANLKVQYSGDNGTSGSNTLDKATAFSGTANQIVTTAADGKVSFKLADDISGIQSVTTGDAKLNTNGLTVTNGPTFTKSNIDANNQQIHKVLAGTANTDAANVSQVKAATTEVKAGTNASLGTTTTDTTDNHKIYTVNVDNLSLSQNGTKVGTGVTLKNGLDFQNGTNTTASVTADGKVSFSISNDAIKAQAKNAVVLTAGDNVTIDTPTDANNVKTYTVKVNDLKLQANGEDKGTRKLAEGINFADGKNTTATVEDGKVIYSLNDTLTGLTSMTAKDTAGNQTLVFGSGVTITPAAAGAQSISLTTNGLSMGGQQITNVQSGGDTDTNAANISDVKRLVQASASGTTETGFNVKGDDATAQKVKLGKQLNVIGGTNKAEELSDNNIGVVTTADAEGNATLTVKLNKNINLDSVKAGNTTLDTNGVSNGKMSLTGTGMTITDTDTSKQVSVTTSGVSMGSQRIQNVADATQDTDAATLKQVKNARTVVAGGSNVAGVTPAEGANNQMTYTVNVDNLSVKANSEEAKSVMLKNGLTFNDGTNTTASVGEGGVVSFGLKPEISLTKVTTGSSALDTNGLTIKEGSVTKVAITSGNVTIGGNVIHNVGAGVASTDAVNKGQLEALQNQVSGGWNLVGKNSDGTAVTAKIGAGKTVTYTDGAYTKSVVTKGDDDSDNATVKVDVTTGTLTVGADGRITSANGLATTGDVANAINSASVNVVADNTPDNKTSVKAGDTIHFAKDDNLTLTQDGTKFTYGLNKEISISKVTTSDTTNGSTVQDAKGITTTDAAGNTYIQDGKGITLTPSDKTKSPVKLTNTGLNNGGNKITGVGKGTDDADAVNVAQLKEVNDKVGSGWQIAGNDGQKVADIGAGKKVSFKTDSQYLTADTKTAGTDAANVTYGLKTKTLTAADGKVSAVDTAEDGLATAKNVAETINQTYWTAASGKSGSGSQTDETANPVDKQISAGDTVTFNAGNNLSLVQNGASFTYGLQADLTGMNTITFTPKNDAEGHPVSLVIGKQKDGVSTNEGYYITGLDNTSWNQSNYVKNRAATEAQLADAIKQVTLASQSGGFKLSDDNNKEVSQVLGQAIGVVGDSNITTTAETTTTDTNGHIKVSLNKTLNLTDQGSVTIGSSQVSDGSIVLNNTDATKKITLNSKEGTASIGGVTVNGTAKTVSGLSNTEWNVTTAAADGYKESNQAATESQLQTVYNQATKTASENELHTLAKEGGYTVDDAHQVSMDVVNGKGEKKDSIVIKDLAKASEVGTVSEIADDLKTKNGDKVQPTSVVEAINNLNDKVGNKNYSAVQGKEIADGDNTTTAIGKLNNRMNDIYNTSTQHSSVSVIDDGNLTLEKSKNDSKGTDYKIGLNKEQINLGNVTIKGNAGSISAQSMTADSFTAGDTVVDKNGVKVGDKSALMGDSLKVNGKTYISSDGLNANSQKITNVQTGTADTDAANVGQMRKADAELADAIQQTDAGLNEVGRAVNKLGNRLNRVGAGAAALAALHPGTYDPNDKWDFSAGIGHYHDANAVAIGAYYHPNDTTILSIGGSMGGGENMVNAGITWKMGRSSHEPAPVVVRKAAAAPVVQPSAPVRLALVVTPAPVTAPVPAKTVVPPTPVSTAPAVPTTAITAAPSGDTAALTQILARQTAILEKLAQNQSQAARPTAVAHGDDIFPDVPENHWAYAYVAKLEKAGALKGFKRPAVLKSPMMTRDDFASVLYTAMANGATTNSALNGDDSLNRLAQEFKAELKDVKP
ncbi:YadA-like family protein [Megasphaera elsdenii]|uniref:YadA-like family protein n=1 Tax=Megasphaera elsdenii TaxID=907 RepID=UPI0004864DE0